MVAIEVDSLLPELPQVLPSEGPEGPDGPEGEEEDPSRSPASPPATAADHEKGKIPAPAATASAEGTWNKLFISFM